LRAAKARRIVQRRVASQIRVSPVAYEVLCHLLRAPNPVASALVFLYQ
jgi:hypothetical protein